MALCGYELPCALKNNMTSDALKNSCVMQSQNAVTAYFPSAHLLPLAFAEQICVMVRKSSRLWNNVVSHTGSQRKTLSRNQLTMA